MTRALPFTQQTVRRAIAAARKEGLHVVGIRPDGTVIVGDNPDGKALTDLPQSDNAAPSKWEDVEA